MLNEYEKGVTLRTLKKILNVQKTKSIYIAFTKSQLEERKVFEHNIKVLETSIELVGQEEVRENKNLSNEQKGETK